MSIYNIPTNFNYMGYDPSVVEYRYIEGVLGELGTTGATGQPGIQGATGATGQPGIQGACYRSHWSS